ncbi:MAG: PorT family protein [Flavipsychrobacter sp.]|nr:PorT family protein [Flavipsychrobacter sp.]
MKNILLAVTLFLLPAMAGAQLPPKPNIDLGLKAGANFAQLRGDSWENGYKANFLAGMFTGIRFKKFGVQAEAFFSQTSYTTTGPDFYTTYPRVAFRQPVDSSRNGRFSVGYINIPLLLQFKVLPMLWVQAGPQYSGIVSVRDADELVQDAKALFTNNDFCGVVGLELKTPVKVVVGARYVFGLSSINNTSTSGAWQQNTIQLHAGFSFL